MVFYVYAYDYVYDYQPAYTTITVLSSTRIVTFIYAYVDRDSYDCVYAYIYVFVYGYEPAYTTTTILYHKHLRLCIHIHKHIRIFGPGFEEITFRLRAIIFYICVYVIVYVYRNIYTYVILWQCMKR